MRENNYRRPRRIFFVFHGSRNRSILQNNILYLFDSRTEKTMPELIKMPILDCLCFILAKQRQFFFWRFNKEFVIGCTKVAHQLAANNSNLSQCQCFVKENFIIQTQAPFLFGHEPVTRLCCHSSDLKQRRRERRRGRPEVKKADYASLRMSICTSHVVLLVLRTWEG